MVSSNAKTVSQYLQSLPAGRRSEIEAVRKVVLGSLPRGYEEGMQYGMICWFIPLSRFAETYNGQALGIAALASQKGYNALYLMGPVTDPAQRKKLEAECNAMGKKLDMGKSCLRFTTVEDVPLRAVAEILASTPPDWLIDEHEKVHAPRRAAGKLRAAKNATKKKAKASQPSARSRR